MDGLYLACWLTRAQAEQLALDGGEPSDKLHVTLCCVTDDGSPNLEARVSEAAQAAATDTAPLVGQVGGLGVFAGEDADALYGSVDVVGLAELRFRLVVQLEQRGLRVDETHGFTPHVTLAYLEPDTPVAVGDWQPVPLTLDSLTVCQPDMDPDEMQPIAFSGVRKDQQVGVRPDLHLQVIGVHRSAGDANLFVYRTQTADGHYVGRTSPTRIRAAKGDILTIAPAEITVDGQGDIVWVDPEVVARWQGRADSQRAVRESVTKEQPASGDVHVDVPLGSNGKPRKRKPTLNESDLLPRDVQVAKLDPARRLVYGVVLEPHVEDTQGDWETPEDIEQAAHRFLYKQVPLGLQHGRLAPEAVRPVESFVAPVDFAYPENPGDLIRKGSWVVVAHVADEQVWKATEDGLFNGWSIGGTGRRSAAEPMVPLAAVAKDTAEASQGILERLVSSFEGLLGRPAPEPPNLHVHVPEQPAPVIHNHLDPGETVVHVAAPDVHVDVAAPEVHVAAPEVQVTAPEVHNHVTVEPPKPVAVRVETAKDGSRRYVPQQ